MFEENVIPWDDGNLKEKENEEHNLFASFYIRSFRDWEEHKIIKIKIYNKVSEFIAKFDNANEILFIGMVIS